MTQSIQPSASSTESFRGGSYRTDLNTCLNSTVQYSCTVNSILCAAVGVDARARVATTFTGVGIVSWIK